MNGVTCTKAVDELINELVKMREQVGGDCKVRMSVRGILLTPSIHLGTIGKGSPEKLVSRGGKPCVLFMD